LLFIFCLSFDANVTIAVSERLFVWQQFEAVIQAVDEGKPVDLSTIPPPPGQSGASARWFLTVLIIQNICIFFTDYDQYKMV